MLVQETGVEAVTARSLDPQSRCETRRPSSEETDVVNNPWSGILDQTLRTATYGKNMASDRAWQKSKALANPQRDAFSSACS